MPYDKQIGSSRAADQVDLSFLEKELAEDVRESLAAGIAAGVAFEVPGQPDELFRAAVAEAIRSIEAKDPSGLLSRFLTVGPYFDPGKIPRASKTKFMPDDEVAAAIRLIHDRVISTFQGALAELLAVGPICEIARRAFGDSTPRVFAGDAVLARKAAGNSWAKGADFHLLNISATEIRVCGVAEVKSYKKSSKDLEQQMAGHLSRAERGLLVSNAEFGPAQIRKLGRKERPLQILVSPGTWKLSRDIAFESHEGRTFLAQPVATPPKGSQDGIREVEKGKWRVTLRWSKEALSSVAYEMTFWYMGELGRLLYSDRMPEEWKEMTPEEAGRNAAKMMLYYAMLRARSEEEESNAIALYNSYGFGYSLGSNFVDRGKRRRELFFEDLQEIVASADGRCRIAPIEVRSKSGRLLRVIPALKCRIRGRRHPRGQQKPQPEPRRLQLSPSR